MTPPVSQVASDPKLPDAVDAVIVGGGISGVATAWELAKRGKSVALLEKGVVGGEQSSRNWGWCRQQNRNERELPLAILALRLWETLAHETGADLGFRRTGLIYVSNSDADIEAWEKWQGMAHGYGVDTRMCSRSDLQALLPGHSQTWRGGVHSPTDGHAEPSFATSVLAKAAQAHGATIHQMCAVREIEFKSGHVGGVITEQGLIRCNTVLVAAGAWTGMLLRHHGVPFIQASIQSTSFSTKPGAIPLSKALSMPNLSLRPRLDGGYTVGLSGFGKLHLTPMGLRQWRAFWPTFLERRKKLSYTLGTSFFNGPDALRTWQADSRSPFEETRILDPKPDARLLRRGLKDMAAAYPTLKDIAIDKAWGGLVDCTPDAIPVISAVSGKPGLFISAGHSAHGFGVGPAVGRLAADLMTGSSPCVDPAPFRYDRMIDGTNLGSMGMI